MKHENTEKKETNVFLRKSQNQVRDAKLEKEKEIFVARLYENWIMKYKMNQSRNFRKDDDESEILQPF